MKIKKQKLLQALTLVKPGLAKNGLIDGTDSFNFMDNSIRAHNDDIQISVDFKIGLKGSIPSQNFYNLLSKIPDEEIEMKQTKNQIILAGKKKTAKFIFSEVSKAIQSYVNPKELKWKNLPKDFSECLKFCLFSVGEGTTRLGCIFIKENYVTSSDDLRITRRFMEKSIPLELLITGDSVKELVKYNPSHFCKSNSWIHFKNRDGVLFSCRLIEGVFPDVKDLLEIKGIKIRLPKNLTDSIDRAKTMVDPDNNYITLSLSKGLLTCKGRGKNGLYEEEKRAIYSGPNIEIRVNPEFLSQILPILDTVILGENVLSFRGENFTHVLCINEALPTAKSQDGVSF